ncbi:MAG: serine/threonine protein phosphatase [Deltaproteobacteria bacterium]|nr:serine/threonine protein phosphatase [Deltaproteobacteria bacterium]
MMLLSNDPKEAEQQMYAVLYYLTTFGYIDGDFDLSEREFIQEHIQKLAELQVRQSGGHEQLSEKDYKALVQSRATHYNQVFEEIDRGIRALFHEAVAANESLNKFVYSRLKLRCYEIFQRFNEENRTRLMDVIDEFILADGVTHPAEVEFRNELANLLNQEILLDMDDLEIVPTTVSVAPEMQLKPTMANHPLLRKLEQHYSADEKERAGQAKHEMDLVDRAILLLNAMRAKGKGRLNGASQFFDLMQGDEFLDDHVFCIPPKPGRRYDITVLGDLHGCYSSLKAALLQADFFNKVDAFRRDPDNAPEPKLILIGDYIDRGNFSYNGTLRAVLNLFVRYPGHVYPLRGNHEYYFEYEGKIYGGVLPAEAINGYRRYFPKEFFLKYMSLFDELPTVVVFDQMFFVHAGIPKESTLDGWKDLSSLNDDQVRFEMIWSDPSEADVIPRSMQEDTARFPFGKKQFASFMNRVGCNVMVRGHTKVVEGFKTIIDDGNYMLLNLFSAGGKYNDDLPLDSSYRDVTPKALTIDYENGEASMTPWAIDYEEYNSPVYNRFFSSPPEIEPDGD